MTVDDSNCTTDAEENGFIGMVVAAEGCLSLPHDLETFTEGKDGVNVHFTKGLPLPSGEKHSPIDALAFVYEEDNEESLNTIRQSLPYVDLRYFVGKCFIIVISGCRVPNAEDIEDLAASFHIPIHYVSRQTDPLNPELKPRLIIPSGLMSVYCPPTGNDVNSLIVESAILHGTQLLND